MKKKTVALMLALNMLFNPVMSLAAPTIPGFYGKVAAPDVNKLPELKPGGKLIGATVPDAVNNTLTINQNQSKATIDWKSFNIGAKATVYFKQQKDGVAKKDWTALNRIYDNAPSLIYGKLKADGKVYLINQNGILFAPGSQVNVHSLVASAMNLRDPDFLAGALNFYAENYQDPASSSPPDSLAVVANYGNITTTAGGSVFLLGPRVENGGSIVAPSGKIDLIAAMQGGEGASATIPDIKITENLDYSSSNNDVTYWQGTAPGEAVNLEGGLLRTDSGQVNMYGGNVWQNGVIRAISAVKQNGRIYLAARDKVTTGTKSVTDVSPDSSSEKVSQTFSYSGGAVKLLGLDTTDGNTVANQPLQKIEHYGAIYAPSGRVELAAVQRVYLETGSSITVGGVWVDEPASANLIEAQLNSVQLADAYSQKNGITQGLNISTTLQNGASFGDISGSYLLGEQTTRERSTTGGSIIVGSFPSAGGSSQNVLNEFIAKQGATLDFSGGGFRYAAGIVPTTKLRSGNKIYDISNAPQSLKYQAIVGDQKVVNQKFGVTREFKGIYFGGGAGLSDYAPARTVGSNAGTLKIAARQVVLDGILNGSVTRGQFQTNVTAYTSDDHRDYDISVARGLEAPVGGTLLIGNDPGSKTNPAALDLNIDSVVNEIVVKPTVAPLAGFDADTTLTDQRTDPVNGLALTELSAEVLNNAGLSQLGLYTNTSLTIEAGARISLLPGGSYTDSSGARHFASQFTATGRRIENFGQVNVPGGSAMFMLKDNITSFATDPVTSQPNPSYIPLASTEPQLYFAPGSVVSVRGLNIDNSSAGNNPGQPVIKGSTGGGQITIQDLTLDGTLTGNNLTLAQGALLDVSGGYVIDQKGKISGGDAGALTLKAMNLSLAGELRGLALPGQKGGQINLHAGEIVVVPADLPSDNNVNGRLLLADNRFRDTGFTRIGLTAINDVSFSTGTFFAPSTERLAAPVPGGTAEFGNRVVPAGDAVNSPDYLGATSLTATAGSNIYSGELPGTGGNYNSPITDARITVDAGAVVTTAPGGSLTMKAAAVDVKGTLASPGGSVKITATGADNGATDLTVGGEGLIQAAGYNKPDTTTVAGRPVGLSPQAGGSVTLVSEKGSVNLESGSTVDVSGSEPTECLTAGAGGAPVAVTTAGAAGSLTLSFDKTLVLDGNIIGAARYEGVQGGTLSVKKTNNYTTNTEGLSLTAAEVARYQAAGFDALTFQSSRSLTLQGAIDTTTADPKSRLRSLTLDAPLVTGTGDDVTFRAAWLRLVNTSGTKAPQNPALGGGTATFALAGDWVDLEGGTSIANFSDVRLAALRDLRLADRYDSTNKSWMGSLETAGNLTLQGARIYPTTASSFTITSHGKVTIQPSGYSDSTPVYSAGGNLTISADKGIEHNGVLAAPMGSINLIATGAGQEGRVYLSDTSMTTTTGSAPVFYGSFDGTYWTVKDTSASSKGQAVQEAPDKSITLGGEQVIVKEGAQLDLAGGGSVYTYMYQTGIEGTANPISVVGISQLTNKKTRSDRYVIMPDNSVQLPGYNYTYTDTDGTQKSRLLGAIHLEGIRLKDGTYLKEGTYALLPEQFAFLPGALVLSDLGTTMAPGTHQITQEGYQVVAGYGTFLGTGIQSQVMQGYSVRTAADVLKEGNFSLWKQFVAGDAGSLKISGKTTILAGSFNVDALTAYKKGSLNLSGAEIDVQETVSGLAAIDAFDTPIPQEMMNKLQLSASALSGKGVGTLQLGDENTSQITIRQGSKLNVANITLASNDKVTVESGAEVNAVGTGSDGKMTISARNTETNDGLVDIQADAKVHASKSVTLNADDVNLHGELTVADKGSMNLASNEIFFVSDSFTKSGKGLYLTETFLKSFANYDQVTLTSSSDLNFQRDVAMTVGNSLTLDAGQFTGPAVVTFKAKNINLRNSTGYDGSSAGGSSSLTLNADNGISINGTGNIAFSGFGTVNLTGNSDLTLQGAGSLKTGGDLNMTAARVTTSYYRDANNGYNVTDFSIEAAGAVNIMQTVLPDGTIATPGGTTTPGGSLAITGQSITDSGTIEVASGAVRLAAIGDINITERIVNITDTNGIVKQVTTHGSILAQGSKQKTADPNTDTYLPGGRIALNSANGGVNLASGSVLDVSASTQGDAGAITLSAPQGGVTLSGDLKGNATAGKGGSLTLDTASLDIENKGTVNETNRLTVLNSKLIEGGFGERINIRARNGNLTVDAGQTVAAREIVMTADGIDGNGKIDINGTLTASDGTNGGRVELYAGTDLTLEATAKIFARGSAAGANGGTVVLSSMDGSDGNKVFNGNYALKVLSGAQLDVSGTADAYGVTKGGTVAFRAYQGKSLSTDTTLNNVNMAAIDGTIKGASRVSVEAAKKTAGLTNIDAASIYTDPAIAFMGSNAVNIKNRLFGNGNPNNYHLQAGIELVSDTNSDLTFNTNWDLSSIRPGDEPGVITLRSAGNLNINANLVDHPATSYSTLHSDTMKSSWGINLAAGADMSSANPLAVTTGKGNLTVLDGKLVYSEDAPIRFASGNDTYIGYGAQSPKYMINQTIRYNIGSYGGTVRGETGGDLTIKAGAIQTAIGDIDLRIGGDLDLESGQDGASNPASYSIGSIRTTGEYRAGDVYLLPDDSSPATRNAKASDYWTYQGGGNITLDVEGKVSGKVNRTYDSSNGKSNAWDLTYYGTNSGSKNNETETLSYLTANYEGTDATEGIAAMAGGNVSVRAGNGFTSQVGVFGDGNLSIFSGGDLNGRFRIGTGSGEMLAMGNFGSVNDRQVLEIGASQVSRSEVTVAAMGDLNIGGILNPFNTRIGVTNQLSWNLTYNPDTAVSLVSLTGSVSLFGTPFDTVNRRFYEGYDVSYLTKRQRVLPPIVNIIAAEDLLLKDFFALTPSATGNLRLVAGNDIVGGQDSSMAMVDLPVDSIYGWKTFGNASDVPSDKLFGVVQNNQTVLHWGDSNKIEVSSGRDIVDLKLYLDKSADIRAERDILQFAFNGQNLGPTDLTSIYAGRDINYSFVPNPLGGLGIVLGGAGTLIVQAGRNIDLGNAPSGIQTVGDKYIPPLGDTGSDLIVVAGAARELRSSEARAFFMNSDTFNQSGSDYPTLLDQASDLMDPKNKATGTQIIDIAQKLINESQQIIDQAKGGAIGIKMVGNAYTTLQNLAKRTEISSGDQQKLNDYALQFIVQTRNGVIKPFFDSPRLDGSGSITMVNSQICALGGASDIYVLARGDLNVGKSILSYKQPVSGTGIYTNGGGAINVYGGNNVNVNESKVMTLLGGDITIWSDQGDINAGRGSRTAVSPPSYQDVFDPITGNLVDSKIVPPAVGSGIRAVTYDRNKTAGGDLPIPDPGDIYLFAPQGVIDAGEAGIAGGRVVLGAPTILNAQNISFSAGSMGVPTSGTGVSLGSLTGGSNVAAETGKMAANSSGLGGAKDNLAQSNVVDQFLSKFLDVKVIDFDTDNDDQSQDKQDDQKKKKK